MHDTTTSCEDAAHDDPANMSTAPGNPFLDYAIERGYDPRKKIKKNTLHVVLGQAVIAHIDASGEELVSAPSGPWLYSQGDWSRVNKRWLAVQIEQACVGLGFKSDTKLINETRNWILRQPELWRERAPQSGARS